MLADSNRLGVFNPGGGGAGQNLVGSGADGDLYWSLFNIEGESSLTAQYVTYAFLTDMLADSNRLGVFNPGGGGAGQNVVGSGSDEMRNTGIAASEPGMLALIGLGLAGLGLARRRKLS